MAVSLGINAVQQAGGAATTCTTPSRSTTSGSTLVAFVIYDNTWSGFSDSVGNTWTQRGSTLTSGSVSARCYVAENITGNASHTVTATLSSAGSISVWLIEVLGAATSSYDVANGQVDGSEPFTSGGVTTTFADEMLVGWYGAVTTTGAVNGTDGNGATVADEVDGSATFYGGTSFYRVLSSTGSYDISVSDSGSETTGEVFVVGIKGVDTTAVDQSAFRFGSDDGSESAHGWAASENTNLTAVAGTAKLLRVQLDATGNPAATAFKLKYQKNGSGGYVDVGIGASAGAISYVGGQASGRAGSTGTSAQTFSFTGGLASTPSEGDLVVVAISTGSTADRTITISTPTGYTKVTGADLYANDTYDTNLALFYKFMTSTPDTSVTMPSTGSTADAQRWDIRCFRGVDPTTPLDVTTTSATGTNSRLANPASITPTTAGAWIYVVGAGAGATGGTYTNSELTDFRAGNNNDTNDAMMGAGYYQWTSGAFDPAAFTDGGTDTTNDSWASYTIALRPEIVDNEVYVDTSSNIAAGGEATTARLTAPSGKSGNFTTGRRWDDENGTDTIDIAADYYTEVEWCLNIDSGIASNGDYYEFRVYNSATALSAYDYTPKWTIGTGGSTYNESVSESATATDSLASLLVALGALSEAATGADSVAATVQDAVSVAETASAADSVAGGLALSDSVAESATAAESLIAALAANMALSETATAADGLASQLDSVGVLAETGSAADSLSAIGTFLASIAEAVTASDSVAGAMDAAAALSESGTAADALSSTSAGVDVEVTETVSATDSLSASTSVGGVLSEAAAAADSLAALVTAVGSLSEAAAAVDSATAQLVAAGVLSEAGSLADTLSGIATMLVDLGESVTATDVLSTGGAIYSVDITEAATAAESLAALMQSGGALAEAGSAIDQITAQIGASVAIAEAGASSDALSALLTLQGALSEIATAGDALVAFGAALDAAPERTLRVAYQGRVIRVTRDGRTLTVEYEPRTFRAAGDERVLRVVAASRTIH